MQACQMDLQSRPRSKVERKGGLEDGEGEGRISQFVRLSEESENEAEMITVRAHNKKTGEIMVIKVKKGTPMKEVMQEYAKNRGVNAQKLSWKRRSLIHPPGSPINNKASKAKQDNLNDCTDCGCTSGLQLI